MSEKNGVKRQSKGIPTGGQFAADPKSEAPGSVTLTESQQPEPHASVTKGRVRVELVDLGAGIASDQYDPDAAKPWDRPVLNIRAFVEDGDGNWNPVPYTSRRTEIGTELDQEDARNWMEECAKNLARNLDEQAARLKAGEEEEYSNIQTWVRISSRRDTRSIIWDACLLQAAKERPSDEWVIRVNGREKYTMFGRHLADKLADAERAHSPGTSVTVKPF